MFPTTTPNDLVLKFEKLKLNRWKVSTSVVEERIGKLKKLKANILSSKAELCEALAKDFNKAPVETEITEILPTIDELNIAIRKTAKWMKPQRVCTPLTLLGARSFIQSEAKGVVLIMAPWNYPFYLAIAPLVAAISAGNCVVVKASEKTPNTTEYLRKLILKTFAENEVTTVEGGPEIAEGLLKLPFDHILFTGSTAIGKKVMAAASQHLATVTLELGGKSPTIVHEDANLEDAALKIAWGKFINSGQTCVAPDFVFAHEKIADRFQTLVTSQIKKLYGKDPKKSPDYARLIDERAHARLVGLAEKSIQQGSTLVTGMEKDSSTRYLSPTVLGNVESSHAIMSEELFGPVLPVLRYQKLDQVISHLQTMDKPLAMYLFTQDAQVQKRILNETTSGGLVLNHVILHLANPHLPFGGVGPSGMGNYHGIYGFKAFSHERSVLKQSWFTLSKRLFPPYSGTTAQMTLKLMRKLLG